MGYTSNLQIVITIAMTWLVGSHENYPYKINIFFTFCSNLWCSQEPHIPKCFYR